jgi:hypothetical protein
MHSRAWIPLRIRPTATSPVGAPQVVEFASNLVCLWRHISRLMGSWPATCSGPLSLTHRFIHTAGGALEEFWKKNHLARNSELGVMIRKAARFVFDVVRNRFALVKGR